ncbi:endosomal/lysosomal proton channel TMEM175-like isoform X2 [Asterias amurensis]|uniref:endosomal/lysosomal proton channel TMEM175-like isoform X2 n=1 Tax=Asterias amurensis TaxID=7602 RepID=UPI003AB89EB1
MHCGYNIMEKEEVEANGVTTKEEPVGGTTAKEEAVDVSPEYVNETNEDNVMNTGGHTTTEEDEIGEEDINGCHQTDEEDLGYIVRSEKEWARRHRFMSIDRLNIFSDAVFATITTFMVVPLKEEVQGYEPTENLWSSLLADWYRFLIFVISFWIVSDLWQDHVWILQNVEHVGDIGLILNVIFLMICSLIPFLAVIMGNYYQYALSAQLCGSCILLLTLLRGLMIIFAFRGEKMLSGEFVEGGTKLQLRDELLIITGLKVLLCVLSIGIAEVNVPAALVLLVLTMFADWVCIIAIGLYRKWRDSSFNTDLSSHLSRRLVLENIDMDRTQTFTDGIFIIVATLIILDITTDSLMDGEDDVDENSLLETLQKNKEPILSYLSTFLTIGMIWYINYSIFYYLQRLSRLLLFLNRMSLLFVSVLPLGFQLISVFSVDEADRNENNAVRFHCVLIFFATAFQVVFWLVAHWRRDKHFSSKYHGMHKMRMLCLLLIYPSMSLMLFCASFIDRVFEANVIHLAELLVPVAFILLKFAFELTLHLRRSHRKPGVSNLSMELTETQNGKNNLGVSHPGPIS